MAEYSLELMGLRTVLRTPFEITVSENMGPFICLPQEERDCTIELQSCDMLPKPSDNGLWHGPEYYDSHRGESRIFHCSAQGANAFAVTRLSKDGRIQIDVLPEYLSYFSGSTGIFNRIGMETLLLQYKGLLLHASLIKYKGRTLAFAGPSGVGKSTQAALWEKSLGAAILNGDRAALRKETAGWMAYGSPCAGTSGIYQKDGGPLAAIVVLQQGKENQLRHLSTTEAFRLIYPELSVHHWDKKYVAKAADLCLLLLAEVPVYCLECRPDCEAALLVKKGLGL